MPNEFKPLPALSEYKLNKLSLLSGGKGAHRIGEAEIGTLSKELSRIEFSTHQATSLGFTNMSELWVTWPPRSAIQKLIWRTATKMARIASIETGIHLVPYRAAIDTLDATSCILPHYDSYVAHDLGLRLHLPISTTEGSIGVTFHPKTFDASWWRMDPGIVYAFNNFDPHTATNYSEGLRSHLMCDLLPPTALTCSTLMERQPGIINLEIRNELDARYGSLPPVSTNGEQLLRSNQVRDWIQRTAKSAQAQNLVQSL